MVNFYIYYNTHTDIYIYIYNGKPGVIPGIDRYRNILFHEPNRYSHRYEIDSLDLNNLVKK